MPPPGWRDNRCVCRKEIAKLQIYSMGKQDDKIIGGKQQAETPGSHCPRSRNSPTNNPLNTHSCILQLSKVKDTKSLSQAYKQSSSEMVITVHAVMAMLFTCINMIGRYYSNSSQAVDEIAVILMHK